VHISKILEDEAHKLATQTEAISLPDIR